MAYDVIGVIPARGGSKGIIDKNLQLLNSIPLVAHSILAAQRSEVIEQVFVSTDAQDIKQIAQAFGAEVVNRPPSLATDEATSESVLLHITDQINFKTMIILQCTSPLTAAFDIDQAYLIFNKKGFDSLLSVTKDHGGFLCGGFTWKEGGEALNYDPKNRPRRQDMENRYRENGAIYITSRTALVQSTNRLSGKIGLYEMPHLRSYEVDTPADLQFLREIYPLLNYKVAKALEEKIKKVKLVLFDVDGCFTDGSVYVNGRGEETLRFNRIDGKGIELLREANFQVGVISSEDSFTVRKRMEKLGITEIHLGIADKLDTLKELKEKYNLQYYEIAFSGDDLQDIPVIERIGISFAPSNAQLDVKRKVSHVSNYQGGEGFVRDVVNIILSVK